MPPLVQVVHCTGYVNDVRENKKAEPPFLKAARLSFRPVAFRPCLTAGLALSVVSLRLDYSTKPNNKQDNGVILNENICSIYEDITQNVSYASSCPPARDK
jgi:hypothetical protein